MQKFQFGISIISKKNFCRILYQTKTTICLYLIILLAIPFPVSAKTKPVALFTLTDDERAYLKDLSNRPIEIAYSYDLMQVEFDGHQMGMLEPLLDVLRNELGLTINLRKLNWLDMFATVENGEIDLYGPISITDERREKYITVNSFYRSYGQLVTRTSAPVRSVLGLNNKKIGLLHDSVMSKTLQTYLGPNGEIVYFTNMDDMIVGLTKGFIDAFATVDNAEFEILPYSDIQYEFAIENFYADQGLISMREDMRPLCDILNRYLDHNPQIMDQILKNRSLAILQNQREFFSEEIAYLQANYNKILMFSNTSSYPLCYLENGIIKGIQVETNKIFESLTGINIKIGSEIDFPEGTATALSKLKSGEIMALAGAYYNSDVLDDPALTQSPLMFTDTIRAYSYKNIGDNILGKIIGTSRFAVDYINWDILTKTQPIIYNSRVELTDALNNGSVDAVFIGDMIFNYNYTVLRDYSLHEVSGISAESTVHVLYGAQNTQFNALYNNSITLFRVLDPKAMGVWKFQNDKYKADYIRMRYYQQIWITIGIIVFGIMTIALIILLIRNRRSYKETEEKRQIIISGINYARKIQKNLLPRNNLFEKAFTDYSVIWSPRDIVGGDIYWLKTFDNGTILCVCDCTGHGTPGALLTMLVVSAFESIVNQKNCHDTAQIMWMLDQRLASVLNVDMTNDRDNLDINDGCDLAIVFVAKNGEVKLSSGNTHVFVCDGKSVKRIKGQKLRIGEGLLPSKANVNIITIPANPNNKFYIASDGLCDQLGGNPTRPFGYYTFKQLILENHNEQLATASDKIWKAFEGHMGKHIRRDDVELITFKP